MARLRMSAVGFPLSWHKTSGGTTSVWIGAELRLSREALDVTVPEAKVTEALQGAHGVLARAIAWEEGCPAPSPGKLSSMVGTPPAHGLARALVRGGLVGLPVDQVGKVTVACSPDPSGVPVARSM